MAYFVKNQAGWDDLTKNPNGLIGSYMQRKGQLLEQLAKQQVGVDTSRLKRSIHSEMFVESYGFRVSVGSDNPIARMHHDGTKPHIITSSRGKTLKFNSRGKMIYAAVVHHPGTRPNRYLTDNLPKVI